MELSQQSMPHTLIPLAEGLVRDLTIDFGVEKIEMEVWVHEICPNASR